MGSVVIDQIRSSRRVVDHDTIHPDFILLTDVRNCTLRRTDWEVIDENGCAVGYYPDIGNAVPITQIEDLVVSACAAAESAKSPNTVKTAARTRQVLKVFMRSFFENHGQQLIRNSANKMRKSVRC